jgi:hypothetical protein
MNEQPPRLPAKKLPIILALLAGFLLLAIGILVANKLGRHGPRFAETAWLSRTVQDVTLTTPFEFGPAADISEKLPQPVRRAIKQMNIYQGKGTPDAFVTLISRIEYQPGIQTSIDGAVEGAMKNMGAAIGDPNPKYTSGRAMISGLEGRKVSYNGQKAGQKVHVESIFASRGQKLWQIQVLFEHAESTPDVSRILQSVKINP